MVTKTLTDSDSTSASKNQLADRKDAQYRPLAKKLHDQGNILYPFYGGLDGLSSAFSTMKLGFDFRYITTNLSSAEEMHKWLITPEGALIAALFSIGIITLSILGNYFDDKDENTLKSYIAIFWPYLRAVLKALKNAFKGFKSAIQIIQLLGGGAELQYLIVPVGLTLGIISAINRVWHLWMVNKRKDMMKANAILLNEMQKLNESTLELSLAKLDQIRGKINRQSLNIRFFALVSASYSGIVDALYLYIGVFSLCSLVPPVLIAMTVFTSIYFLTCIATRMYEEYDFQQKLIISQTKIELAAEGKKIELFLNELQSLTLKLSEDVLNQNYIEKQKNIFLLFQTAADRFITKKNKLRSLSCPSYFAAFLLGAKNGLAAYGALTSVLFLVGIMVFPFPPTLLITVIVLGMALLIGFIIHSLVANYWHHEKCEQRQAKETVELSNIGRLFKNAKLQVSELKPEEVKTAILDGMVVDPSPQFYFQESFEILRAGVSAAGKGPKAVTTILAPWEIVDDEGHVHETPVMMGFMVVSALLHSLIFGLRAYARGFGRDPIDAVPGTAIKATEAKPDSTVEECDYSDKDDDEFQPLPNPSSNQLPQSKSMLDSIYTFFSVNQKTNERPSLNASVVKKQTLTSQSLFGSKVNLSEEKAITNPFDFPCKVEGLELDHCTF
ncbi:MAG: hypothetical protein H0U73_04495 [Tatlockia sp.]|nr:hypothetical protein [Tatlockia sp.]